MSELYYPKEKIKVLLLEGIHQAALEEFKKAGYSNVEIMPNALDSDELDEALKSVHILGIRSKTKVTKESLEKAKNLLAVGCFCIGTNQIDYVKAREAAVPVFNAPFSNTRSVAELTIAEIIMLARRASELSMLLHQGLWEKTAVRCSEVRGKTVGIVGYGHIGPQVGLLCESLGMKVIYYDILPKLALGNSKPVNSLDELLQESDFVTLHVPETDLTANMISTNQLSMMKKGSYLINLSRGSVVDLDALSEALRSEHIAGAAVDVYPEEPKKNSSGFECALSGMNNVIMTPHIGGSTKEAQNNIGIEVSRNLISYSDRGTVYNSVNFRALDLAPRNDSHRLINIHKNIPGVLSKINGLIANLGINVNSQMLTTQDDVGFLLLDVNQGISSDLKKAIEEEDFNIKTRLLY